MHKSSRVYSKQCVALCTLGVLACAGGARGDINYTFASYPWSPPAPLLPGGSFITPDSVEFQDGRGAPTDPDGPLHIVQPLGLGQIFAGVSDVLEGSVTGGTGPAMTVSFLNGPSADITSVSFNLVATLQSSSIDSSAPGWYIAASQTPLASNLNYTTAIPLSASGQNVSVTASQFGLTTIGTIALFLPPSDSGADPSRSTRFGINDFVAGTAAVNTGTVIGLDRESPAGSGASAQTAYALVSPTTATDFLTARYVSGTDPVLGNQVGYSVAHTSGSGKLSLALGPMFPNGGTFTSIGEAAPVFVHADVSQVGSFSDTFTATNTTNSLDSAHSTTVNLVVKALPSVVTNNAGTTLDTSGGNAPTFDLNNVLTAPNASLQADALIENWSAPPGFTFGVTHNGTGDAALLVVAGDSVPNVGNVSYTGPASNLDHSGMFTVTVSTYNGDGPGPGIYINPSSATQTFTWNIVNHANNTTGIGSQPVAIFNSYGGIGLGSPAGDTHASIVAGTNTKQQTTVTIDYSNTGNFSLEGVGVGSPFSLSGTNGDEILLDIFVNAADLAAAGLNPNVTPTPANHNYAILQWFNGTNWVPAWEGNTNGGGAGIAYIGEDAQTYAAQIGQNLVAADLGDYGFEYENGGADIWMVIDHNSEFAAGLASVPEPTGLALVICGAIWAGRRRKN